MEIKPLSMTEQLRMIRPVERIGAGEKQSGSSAPAEKTGGASFFDYLSEKVKEVNELGVDAERKIEQAVSGDDPMPHSSVLAVQKAEISFNLLMTVQRRIIEAYREVLRTPIG